VAFGELNLTADSAKQNLISRASRQILPNLTRLASRCQQNRIKFDALLKSLASQLAPSP